MNKNCAAQGNPDIHAVLIAHMEARANRHRYAQEAIDLIAAGKVKQGNAAAKKAHEWEAKMLALEPKPKQPAR